MLGEQSEALQSAYLESTGKLFLENPSGQQIRVLLIKWAKKVNYS